MKTIDTLKNNGFSAHLVGGTVRALCLGQKPSDYDVTTNATPEQMVEIFTEAALKVIPTGLKHFTVTVLDPEYGPVDVTTWRIEGPYSDGRRPDWVRVASSLEEDLSRRDASWNALALDPDTNEMIDLFGGREDLENGIIRAVGDPMQRYVEDPLRMFRAARFSSLLGFRIEDKTWVAMRQMPITHSERIEMLSVERIRDELLKAHKGPMPARFWEVILETGLNKYLLPELDALKGLEQPSKYHKYDAFEHSTRTLEEMVKLTEDPILRFTAILHDIGKAHTQTRDEKGVVHFINHEDIGSIMVREVMLRLKFSNSEIDRVANLVKYHLVPYEQSWSNAAVRRWVQKVGRENVNDLLTLRTADLLAHGVDVSAKLKDLEDLKDRIKLLESKAELTIRLAVTGDDLIGIGFKPGPKLGEVLRALKEIVTIDPAQNTKERLLAYALEMK